MTETKQPETAKGILIRSCRSAEEFAACVELQVEVWGYSDEDVIPRRSFIINQSIGGQVIGAFDLDLPGAGPEGDAGSLVGFAMAMPGLRDGHPFLHSHMLAVRAAYRNRGVGRRLKLAQREDALKRGIWLMEWTFDPLQIKNAYLNIARLGAIVRRYTPNLYGVSSSRLHGSLPTDRLHAEWWMDSARVRATLSGEPVELPEIVETIVVPAAVSDWMREGRTDLAAALQAENRHRFQKAFARGLAVVGFIKDSECNGIFQLGVWQQPGPAAASSQTSET